MLLLTCSYQTKVRCNKVACSYLITLTRTAGHIIDFIMPPGDCLPGIAS